ncbi:MAG: peptidoglycan DD-metalloendopeptidase family protein, partial [Halobacteriovoraceae bacterium]|nr:peptidoglycan DD-metalloendopeptidase family protein [Halobacteriovoraceae bacterium]
VYSGELASYGNIVMIDHGKGTRSVILGDFDPMVKKGMDVAKGDGLGKTKKIQKDGFGNIYFEVRKDDNIQNTILLMNKELLAEDNSSQRI